MIAITLTCLLKQQQQQQQQTNRTGPCADPGEKQQCVCVWLCVVVAMTYENSTPVFSDHLILCFYFTPLATKIQFHLQPAPMDAAALTKISDLHT